ncbi:aromatic-ring-hydroxylating dioxygenase subunit beta [Ramlibacter sp. AN1015]|uniref:aromatic-ring-hydroxylating dioxygenase subunit beta n=1 Tax=Ramlibacter sp. AN1015 TaxID=3133428 RepID=UPI0030C0BE5E
MTPEHKALACELVAREAQLLDQQRWTEWLDLYREDAVFWVPTWKSDGTLSSDPDTELSLIYMDGRALLHERVQRLTSGRSVAAMPVPRTTHLVGGTLVDAIDADAALVQSAWMTHIYLHKQPESLAYAGRYEHLLRWQDGQWRIARKKVVLTNDQLRSKLDFFYV